MSDDDSFEKRLREIADQLAQSLSETDLDDVAGHFGVDPERVRGVTGAVERWLHGRASADEPLFGARPAGRAEDPRGDTMPPSVTPPRHEPGAPPAVGPHPLDLPTAEQGRALAALDSGRWAVRPGSSRLAATGPGPQPPEAPAGPSDLVNELRARDWITADGTVTLVGRQALLRWCHTADSPGD